MDWCLLSIQIGGGGGGGGSGSDDDAGVRRMSSKPSLN